MNYRNWEMSWWTLCGSGSERGYWETANKSAHQVVVFAESLNLYPGLWNRGMFYDRSTSTAVVRKRVKRKAGCYFQENEDLGSRYAREERSILKQETQVFGTVWILVRSIKINRNSNDAGVAETKFIRCCMRIIPIEKRGWGYGIRPRIMISLILDKKLRLEGR